MLVSIVASLEAGVERAVVAAPCALCTVGPLLLFPSHGFCHLRCRGFFGIIFLKVIAFAYLKIILKCIVLFGCLVLV